MVSLLTRKTRSAVIVLGEGLRDAASRLWLRIMQPDLTLGTGTRIGRRVRFRITDGGSAHIDSGTVVDNDVSIVVRGGVLRIGRNGYIGNGTQIAVQERVVIGHDALVAQHCVIRDNDHCFDDPDVPIRLQGHAVAPVEIGDDVWLGANVVVTRGARIGSGAVVGANAVVRGEISALAVAVGLPAREVKKRGKRSERVD